MRAEMHPLASIYSFIHLTVMYLQQAIIIILKLHTDTIDLLTVSSRWFELVIVNLP